ncbi:uncharacterized protein LOC111707079 [Eurytemora carolleeae]|uniref:uncharacterized protein LOC111707079 n=1 Tax=Eurytemora carolleeae TaxID=1294199 RepID=UPI000C761102|nr:uncharacterized protein LOC111707079 [Eurytemora carolleeae]|eukprot:XP_023335847.1 uncharacterized protein LOC111707079 [Eurytemora affinis]
MENFEVSFRFAEPSGNLAVGAGNNVIRIPPSSLTALAGIAAIAVPTAIIGATTAGLFVPAFLAAGTEEEDKVDARYILPRQPPTYGYGIRYTSGYRTPITVDRYKMSNLGYAPRPGIKSNTANYKELVDPYKEIEDTYNAQSPSYERPMNAAVYLNNYKQKKHQSLPLYISFPHSKDFYPDNFSLKQNSDQKDSAPTIFIDGYINSAGPHPQNGFGNNEDTGFQGEGYGDSKATGSQGEGYHDTAAFGYLSDNYLTSEHSNSQADITYNRESSGYQTDKYFEAEPSGNQAGIYSDITPSSYTSNTYSDTASLGYQADDYSEAASSGIQTAIYSDVTPSGYQEGVYSDTTLTGSQSDDYFESVPTGNQATIYSDITPSGHQEDAYSDAASSGYLADDYFEVPSGNETDQADVSPDLTSDYQGDNYFETAYSGNKADTFSDIMSPEYQEDNYFKAILSGNQGDNYSDKMSPGYNNYFEAVPSGNRVDSYSDLTGPPGYQVDNYASDHTNIKGKFFQSGNTFNSLADIYQRTGYPEDLEKGASRNSYSNPPKNWFYSDTDADNDMYNNDNTYKGFHIWNPFSIYFDHEHERAFP